MASLAQKDAPPPPAPRRPGPAPGRVALENNTAETNQANMVFREFMGELAKKTDQPSMELHQNILHVWQKRMDGDKLHTCGDHTLNDALIAMANAMFLPLERKQLTNKLLNLKQKKEDLMEDEIQKQLEQHKEKLKERLTRKFETNSGDRAVARRRRRMS
ncbi:hypothetical protein RI054_24g101910 [Pseudoscourfieldia marina]